MRSFQQQFTIHPVGQGLMYSFVINTTLNTEARKFIGIYDCGSLTHVNINDEVDQFRDLHLREDENRLGLLVISHFDADHVNNIGRMLSGKRKVDKLVMPFTLVEERLFLTLRYLARKDKRLSDDDLFTVRLMIDPIGTLADNMDGDSTIFLVTPGPPEPPAGGNDKAFTNDNFHSDAPELEFDFDDPKDELDRDVRRVFMIGQPGLATLKKVNDSVKGHIHFKSQNTISLMDFLFYHREIGPDEKAFYGEVYALFCKEFSIDTADSNDVVLEKLVKEITQIRGATLLKEIFRKARTTISASNLSKRDIENMNTTALCMLHRNLEAIVSIFAEKHGDSWFADSNVSQIQKFDGTNATKIEQPLPLSYSYEDVWRQRIFLMNLRDEFSFEFPNALLTSDIYLAGPDEVDAFYKKYAFWWQKFWLFQIPHHGSKNNSGFLLFSRLRSRLIKFINYGIRHQFASKYRHPDREVIMDLISTGQSSHVLPISEFNGIAFEFCCRRP